MDQLWSCEPKFLKAYCAKVLAADADTEKRAQDFFTSREDKREILAVEEDTAIITIRGPLTNRVSFIGSFLGFGSTSYADIQAAVETVAADDTISKVRLVIDSPGGTVTGLDETWIALRELAKTKTLVAENHGLMASAAYWLASAAPRIVATSPAAETGSIGVYMLAVDWTEYDKRLGIREIRIVSKNAPLKNPDPATAAGLKAVEERLDALERVFISRVAMGRRVSIETVEKTYGRGSVLIAQDPDPAKASALSVGMIDEVLGIKAESGKDGPRRTEAKNKQVDKDRIKVENVEDSTKTNEGKKMKLADVATKDPELQAEIDAQIAAAKVKPVEPVVTPASVVEAVKPSEIALKALAGEAGLYIKALAAKVLKGEATEGELVAAQAALDQTEEARKALEAEGETAKQKQTPAAGPAAGSDTGEIKTEADYQAQTARFRAERGIE